MRYGVTALLGGALVSGLVLPTDVGAQDRRNFWALNNTQRKISEFYVSPHESGKWGRDVLGDASLPHGIGTVITFDDFIDSSCTMDFKLVFTDGTEQTYEQGRNVCLLGAVQFNRKDSIGMTLPR